MPEEFADIHAIVAQVAKDYQYKATFSMPDWINWLWQPIWQFLHPILTRLFSALAKIMAKLLAVLSYFSQSLPGKDQSGRLLLIVILCLLATAIVLIIWQQRRWLKRNRLHKYATASGGLLGQPHTSKEWQEQAFHLKDQGHFGEACRSLHRACLQILDEANLIVFAPARSNFEYSMALSRLPLSSTPTSHDTIIDTSTPGSIISDPRHVRQAFQSFSHTVDAIYFGNHQAGEAEFQFCLQYLQDIESHLGAIVSQQAMK